MNVRWVAIAFVLGLCAAYALWGSAPPQPPATAPAPPAAGPQTPVPAPKPPNAAALNTTGNGLVKFTPGAVEFGEVLVGNSKKETVAVKNVSDRVLHINYATGSCSCIKATIPAMELAPGASADLALTITGLPGKLSEDRHVELFMEDVKIPAEFEVHAKIVQVFEVTPASLQFGPIARGETKTLSAIVRKLDGKPFQILSSAAANKHDELLIGMPEEVSGSNKSAYKLNVTIKGLHGKRIISQVTVVTDDKQAPFVPLNLFAEIEGEAVALDKRLGGTPGDNGSMVFVTTIKRETPGDLTVTGVSDRDGAPMTFKTAPIGEGCVKLTMTMETVRRGHRPFGELNITTNVETEPIRVSYSLPHQPGMLPGQ